MPNGGALGRLVAQAQHDHRRAPADMRQIDLATVHYWPEVVLLSKIDRPSWVIYS